MSASGFVGSVVRIQSTGKPDTDATVGFGPEYTEFNGGAGYIVDIGDFTTTINKVGFIAFLFSSPGPAQFGGGSFNGLSFSDVNNDLPYIRGAWLDNQVGLSGLTSGDLTTTENSVTIDFQSVIFNQNNQVIINVDFNDAPVASDLGLRTLEGANTVQSTPLSPFVTDLDLADNTFTFSLVQTTQFGSLLFFSNGTFIYQTIDPNFFGQDKFTFKVSDGFGGTDTADFYIDVLAVNDAPGVANETLTSVAEDSVARTISFASLLGNDNAGPTNESSQTLNIIEVRNAVGGTAVIQGTNVIFTPTANFNGTASFEYVVQDNGTSQQGTLGNPIVDVADPKTAVGKASFQITPVNDAPSGTSKTLSINEDAVYTITAADFGFSDTADGHGLLGVLIDPLSGAGSLKLNGAAVTTQQFITAINIDAGRLTFAPTPNSSGNNYGAFSFQVVDNGLPFLDGETQDPTPNQLTFDVTPVNDAPSGADKTITTNEDTAYTFTTGDFGFSDSLDGNTLLKVKITTLSATGTLANDGTAVTAGQFVSAADIATGKLKFTPALNASGTAQAAFTFQVQDNCGTDNGGVDLDASAKTITVNVTAVNDAPSGMSKTLSINEDTSYTLTAADFGFSDAIEGNALLAVKITSLAGAGSLKLDGTAVGAGQFVSADAIAAGKLTFTPSANASGDGHGSFTFQVQDNGGTANGGIDLDPTSKQLTFNVTPVNDAPSGADKTIATKEDTAHTFTTGDFGFADASDGNTLLEVKITTLPTTGTLADSGTAVSAGQFVSAADIAAGKLKFTPALNANGNAQAAFTFQVRDNGGTANGGVDLDVSPNTITVNVTSVNDAPSGQDRSVSTVQGTAYTFAAADFGFVDPVEGNALLAVRNTTIPLAGALSNNGAAVTAGELVAATDITAGKLKFTPPPGVFGTGYATFTFQVQDNGGTANGGVDLDQSANTITVNVAALNSAPSGADRTVGTLEDTPYTFTAADLGFSDLTDGNALKAVKVTTVPGAGTLLNDGVALSAGAFVDAAAIAAGKLTFAPALNGHGNGYASFAFQVQDDAGTANGGTDLDPTPNTITVNVAAVNDAPSGADTTVSASEDTPYVFATADFGFSDTADGDALLAVKIATLPAGGILLMDGAAVTAGQFVTAADIAAGLLTFAPAANANGSGYARFTFQVQDAGGTADGGADLDLSANTITIDVAPVDDVPVAGNDLASVNEDAAIIGQSLTANDTPGDGSNVYALDTQAANGTVTVHQNGTFDYAPNANFNGSDSFNYRLTDADGEVATATVEITVAAVEDQPVNSAPGPQTVAEDTDLFITGLGVSDGDGDDLGITTTLTVTQGTLTILAADGVDVTGNGTASVTLAGTVAQVNAALAAASNVAYRGTPDYNGPDQLTIKSTDGTSRSDSDSVTITVTPVHDDVPIVVTTLHDELDSTDPHATLAQLGGAGDLSLREALLLAAQDPEADTITFAPGLSGGKLTLDPTLEGRGGNLFIAQEVTIDGDLDDDGVADITIDGGDASRLFYVDTAANAELVGLTLQNGRAQGGNAGSGFAGGGGGLGAGGAIFVASGARLHVEDVQFGGAAADGNAAIGGNGTRVFGRFVNGAPGGVGFGGSAFGPGGNPNGGSGGFGGGGAGGYTGYSSSQGGSGGFGGGAGGGGSRDGGGGSGPGAPGFGGGSGRSGYGGGYTGGGGGGAGLGGAVFIQDGASVSFGGGVSFENNSATGGIGGGNGFAGSGLGTGLFLQRGGVTFAPAAGETVTIRDTIADATDTSHRAGTDPGSVTLDGEGTLILQGGNTYTSATTVRDGVLQVDGAVVSAVTVEDGGTLGGAGRVGAVTIESGGTLSPGNSPGILHTGSVTLVGGAHFKAEIGGTAAGDYDQAAVQGTVDLGGAKLEVALSGGFSPATGAAFTIIDNDGSDSVTGTFADIAEGGQLVGGGRTFTISYTGGDGNDVVLTALNDAPIVTLGSGDSADLARREGDAGLTGSGTLSVTDLDAESVTTRVTTVAVSGNGAADLPGELTEAVLKTFLTVAPTALGGQTTGTVTWSFDSGSEAFGFLAAGQQLVLGYTVTATDDGAFDEQIVTVTITGTNDTPVGVDDDAAVNEDATVSGMAPGVLANDTDVDAGATRLVTAVNGAAANVGVAIAGAYGTLTLDADGSYTYVADRADALAGGAVVTDTFSYTVHDGTSAGAADLVIAVTGLNDAPTTSDATLDPVEVNSGTHLITETQLLAHAADAEGDELRVIDLRIETGSGSLADNHDGTWSFTPKINDDSAVTFAYRISDGALAVSAEAKMDITSAQAAPEIGSPGNDTYAAVTGNSRYDAGLGVDTMQFDFRLVDATVTYSGNEVIIDGPANHTVLTGFERFVFTDGTVDNNDGDRLVDDLFYYSRNHDVWNAQADADQHFRDFGWHEARDPNAWLSSAVYLSANPDVRGAGIDPLTHFDQSGWREGRAASITFDAAQYLAANPDVAAAGVDPLAHYLGFGYEEGRVPVAPDALLAANGFDYVYYLQHNPDVAAAHVDPFLHYQTTGWQEGRNPNAWFDAAGYLAAYSDVSAAGINPLDHYHAFGWHEGRDPSGGFDTTAYLAANPDVQAAGVDPLLHYLEFGRHEGRSPQADGLWG